jgi:hypothetical protein
MVWWLMRYNKVWPVRETEYNWSASVAHCQSNVLSSSDTGNIQPAQQVNETATTRNEQTARPTISSYYNQAERVYACL